MREIRKRIAIPCELDGEHPTNLTLALSADRGDPAALLQLSAPLLWTRLRLFGGFEVFALRVFADRLEDLHQGLRPRAEVRDRDSASYLAFDRLTYGGKESIRASGKFCWGITDLPSADESLFEGCFILVHAFQGLLTRPEELPRIASRLREFLAKVGSEP